LVNVEVFTQNSIRITGSIGKIYVDPFQMKDAPNDADFILITHDHYDHFSPEDIAKVCKSDTVLVVPEKMLAKAKDVSGIVKSIETVAPGESRNIAGLELETIPAYNMMKPFHGKNAGWVGYVVSVDGKRVYVAGDTDATKEAKAVKCDIALIPIGGTYTMNAKQAAELVNEIKPEVAIPVHYGGIVGSPKDAQTFAGLVKEPVKVEIIMKY
jgi:L-ascorbate metabolism protein UlaG (beta-lactamase superfamily)